MKKILLSLLVVFSVFCLTACDSSNESIDNLLTVLQKEKIVDKNLKLIDKVVDINAGIHISRTTYYIYENENSKLIAINYNTDLYSKNDYDYSITIYSNVTINNDIEYLDDDVSLESYYVYADGKKSESSKYYFGNSAKYLVYESKPLFSKTKYRIEKTN